MISKQFFFVWYISITAITFFMVVRKKYIIWRRVKENSLKYRSNSIYQNYKLSFLKGKLYSQRFMDWFMWNNHEKACDENYIIECIRASVSYETSCIIWNPLDHFEQFWSFECLTYKRFYLFNMICRPWRNCASQVRFRCGRALCKAGGAEPHCGRSSAEPGVICICREIWKFTEIIVVHQPRNLTK